MPNEVKSLNLFKPGDDVTAPITRKRGKNWKPHEDRILKKAFNEGKTDDEIHELLPERTLSAIGGRRAFVGAVSFQKKSTKEKLSTKAKQTIPTESELSVTQRVLATFGLECELIIKKKGE